jgi:uncharacterized protein Usg
MLGMLFIQWPMPKRLYGLPKQYLTGTASYSWLQEYPLNIHIVMINEFCRFYSKSLDRPTHFFCLYYRHVTHVVIKPEVRNRHGSRIVGLKSFQLVTIVCTLISVGILEATVWQGRPGRPGCHCRVGVVRLSGCCVFQCSLFNDFTVCIYFLFRLFL